LPGEQQSIIRYWTRREGELLLEAPEGAAARGTPARPELFASFRSTETRHSFHIWQLVVLAAVLLIIGAVLMWWRWQQQWRELEAQVPVKEATVAQPQLKVPAREMEQRIIHEVTPEYPEPARLAGVQGTVVLDTVVSPEGAVAQVKLVSGPEALSQAAMDAVRWWRYEPYLVNGQPTTVETTVAVDFRLAN